VRAEDDCEVIEISKPAMASVLRDAPECLTQLSELLATRKMETEGLLKDVMQDNSQNSTAREYRATFLRRLRSVFEL
jgi:CRP-like cAMP-binding protein